MAKSATEEDMTEKDMPATDRRMTRQLGGEPRFVTRRIGADTIIVPIASRTGDLDCVYTLNEVASRIWDELDTPRSAAEIAAELASEFDAPANELMADVAEFLETLKAGGLARLVETEK
jgi:hypothetical protein